MQLDSQPLSTLVPRASLSCRAAAGFLPVFEKKNTPFLCGTFTQSATFADLALCEQFSN